MRHTIRVVAAVTSLTLAAGAETPPAAPLPGSAVGIGSVLQPGTAAGDFEFQSDAIATQPGAPGRITVRVLVQLPVRAFLDQTHADHANVRVVARAFNAKAAFDRLAVQQRDLERDAGRQADAGTARSTEANADLGIERLLREFDDLQTAAEAEAQTPLEAADRAKLLDTDYRLFDLALDLAPGDYVIESRVENLSRKKRGLLDRLRKRPLTAVARVLLRVPDLRLEPALADPAFASGYGVHAATASRLYGLLSDSLHVRSTLYGNGTYRVRVQAADRDGKVQWCDSLQVEASGATRLAWSSSVNTFPAGQQVLSITAAGPGGAVATARGFDVAWSLVTWTTTRRDLDGEAELALGERQYDQYRALPQGERERFMEQFWALHDPTPDTAFNETRSDFVRRVAYADLNFQETSRGALTDRGRVYVRYGPPDEVQFEAVPSHLAGRGAEQAIDKVDDVYVPSEHRKSDDQVGSMRGTSSWDGAMRTQERGRVVGFANEVTAYDLWIYHGAGAPILAEDQGVAIDGGLRVLFMDTTGYGHYRVRKASSRLDIRGLTANF